MKERSLNIISLDNKRKESREFSAEELKKRLHVLLRLSEALTERVSECQKLLRIFPRRNAYSYMDSLASLHTQAKSFAGRLEKELTYFSPVMTRGEFNYRRDSTAPELDIAALSSEISAMHMSERHLYLLANIGSLNDAQREKFIKIVKATENPVFQNRIYPTIKSN